MNVSANVGATTGRPTGLTSAEVAVGAAAQLRAAPRTTGRLLQGAALWRAVARRVPTLPPVPELPVGPDMPQRFGDHYRWPDGSWHYCC